MLNSAEGFSCSGAFPNCKDMVQNITTNPCDVVLMDIEMPGMNGIEATQLIKKHFSNVLVLIQTVFFEDEYIFDAICAGASGYILKTTTPEDYSEAIRNVQSGGSPMTPGIARRVLELFKTNLQPQVANNDYNLTPTGKKVLQLLVEGKALR